MSSIRKLNDDSLIEKSPNKDRSNKTGDTGFFGGSFIIIIFIILLLLLFVC